MHIHFFNKRNVFNTLIPVFYGQIDGIMRKSSLHDHIYDFLVRVVGVPFHIDIGHRIVAFDINQSAEQDQRHSAKRNPQNKKAFMQPEDFAGAASFLSFLRQRRLFLSFHRRKLQNRRFQDFLLPG